MEFKKKSAEDFVQELSSSAPVPGGGGASALSASIGMALGTMVSSLTIGKKKYAIYEDELKELKQEALQIQENLLNLIDRDADGFLPLSKAYGLPHSTEEEIEERNRVMEEALVGACQAPLEIMENIARAIEITQIFAEKGSKLAISDAGVSAAILGASLKGASLNVFINTKMLKDREIADRIDRRAESLIQEYSLRADSIFEYVRKNL